MAPPGAIELAWGERLLLYPLALVEALLGRAERARAAAGRRLAEAQLKGERPGEVRARGVLGLLALSEGDLGAAGSELRAAAALLEDTGFAHPGAFPVLPDAIEALACGGDVKGARTLLARLERQAGAVDAPWPRAAAERSRGVVLLAEGEADAAAGCFERAAGEFDRLGHRLDAARATFLAGRAMLRANRRIHAAEALADARARFAALGATLWEARVVEELDRAAPGRANGALTPAERRIAALVAEGKRNREIGATLFMSTGTVEAHLTRLYRKLDIRSRTDLTRLIADGVV